MGSRKDGTRKDFRSFNGCSVDIYLFSNGQQDSPPRKYNVRVDDRWDTTLNFLARSQHGSDHTIELYTTDGKIISKAQELSNGGAYVAVEPPQQFIPSGYNEYLMKASKSREKRQEKLHEDDILTKPDIIKHKIEEQNKDGTNIKIIQDITITPSSRTAVNEREATMGQVKSDVAKNAKPFGRISDKQSQKQNSPLPQSKPYTLRKNTINVSPSINKKSTRKLETPFLRSTKTNPIAKVDEKGSKTKVSGVINIIKHDHENTENVGAYDLLKNVGNAHLPHNSNDSMTDFKTIQEMTTDSTRIERNTLLPVSLEKELPQSMYALPISIHSKFNLLANSTDPLPVSDQDVKLIPDKLNGSTAVGTPLANFPKETDKTHVKETELINVLNNSEKNAFICDNQTGTNNFTIYVKQNELKSLMLNIEIKNMSSSTLVATHSHHVKSTTSVVPINTSGSIGEASTANTTGAKNCRDALTLTEPRHGDIPSKQLQQMSNQDAVCGCNLCSCSRTEGGPPVYFDNNNYFIMLPQEEINEQLLSDIIYESRTGIIHSKNQTVRGIDQAVLSTYRCYGKFYFFKVVFHFLDFVDAHDSYICKLETNQEPKPDIRILPIREHFVRLVDGEKKMVTNDLNKNFERSKTVTIHDRIFAQNQSLAENARVDTNEQQCECCSCSLEFPTSTCVHAQIVGSECVHCNQEPAPDVAIKEHAVSQNPLMPMFKDAVTQTDWSGIVLEVRQQRDGNYEFYIPSLKYLKANNSLYR